MYRCLLYFLYSIQFNPLEIFSLISETAQRMVYLLEWKIHRYVSMSVIIPCGGMYNVHPFADVIHNMKKLTRSRSGSALLSFSLSRINAHLHILSENISIRLSLDVFANVWILSTSVKPFRIHTFCTIHSNTVCSVYKKLLNAIVMLHMILLSVRMWKREI